MQRAASACVLWARFGGAGDVLGIH